jgi:hypothetical protein
MAGEYLKHAMDLCGLLLLYYLLQLEDGWGVFKTLQLYLKTKNVAVCGFASLSFVQAN